jgi:hypothetical protein
MLVAYLAAIGVATTVFLMIIYLSNSDLLVRTELFSDATRPSDIFQPFVMILVGIVTAVCTLLPVLFALVFAEMCGSQSARYFLAWGFASWAGLWLLFGLGSWIQNGRTFEALVYDTAAFAVGGLTWGSVYWIIAGRTSGDWIDAERAR